MRGRQLRRDDLGAIILWRLREEAGAGDEERIELVEQQARRLVRVSIAILAAYVAVEAIRTLAARDRPDASPVGIVLTAISIGVMLWLARAKRETGEALGSRSLPTATRRTPAGTRSVTTLVAPPQRRVRSMVGRPTGRLMIAVFLVREGPRGRDGEDDDD